MKKLRRNNKGFTLIELLAVIVILAILMTLAITSMSGYITDSKKNTFVSTANQYLNSVRYSLLNGDYEAPATGGCTVVSMSKVDTENNNTNSTFGAAYDWTKSYVVIANNGGQYEYYMQMIDAKNNGFELMPEQQLDKDDIDEGTARSSALVSEWKPGGTAPNAASGFCTSVTAVYPNS